MTSPISFVQIAAYELAPGNMRMPPMLWSAFSVASQIHGVWRWARRAELYSNPDNFAQLLAGHVVNFVIGDMMLIRVAAQALLVATRLLGCVQQQTALMEQGQRWMDAVSGHYPKPIKVSWDRSGVNPCCSPSFTHYCKVTAVTIKERIIRIASETFVLFVEAFKLSMKMMDTIDTLSLNPAQRYDGVTESFVNITKLLDSLIANKEELMEGLNGNKGTIIRLLQGSPISYEQLHSAVEKTLEQTENVQSVFKKGRKLTGDFFIDGTKRLVNDTMIISGLSNLLPNQGAKRKHRSTNNTK